MQKLLFRVDPGDGDEQDTGGWGDDSGSGWETDVDGGESGGWDDSSER